MGHYGDDAVHKKSNKIKRHLPNRLKILVLVYFNVLFSTRYNEVDVKLVQCLFKHNIKVSLLVLTL